MAKKYCDYQGCLNVRNTHGNITFFTLPNDERRNIWIQNSGNEQFKFLNNKSVRFICEEHFDRRYVRNQFSRTTLSRSAVPIPYNNNSNTIKSKQEEFSKSKDNTEENMSFDFYIQKNEETEDDNSKDIIVYDIEYCENDTNSNAYESDTNSIRLNSDEIISQDSVMENVNTKNPSLIDEEENIIERIDQNELCEYLDSDQVALDDLIREENHSKDEVSIKKNEKYSDIDEYCSSNEISSSTIELNQNKASTRIINTTQKKIIDDDYSKTIPPVLKKIKRLKHTEIKSKPKVHAKEDVTSKNKDYEEDMHFALSLVGNFQRLPSQKKALAKIKILEYLMKLEFSDVIERF